MSEIRNYTLAQVVCCRATKKNAEELCDRYYHITGIPAYAIYNRLEKKCVIFNQKQISCLKLGEGSVIFYSKVSGLR